MQQRSNEWYNTRAGKFTASEITKLMGIKGLGQTGDSYILSKAIEEVFGISEEEDFTSFDMRRGIELEPVAFDEFKNAKELDFVNVRECSFFTYGLHAGASPDGLVGKNGILEIKCPKAEKFFSIVLSDEVDTKYFHQMQMQMLCTGRTQAHYFNFIIYNGKPMSHEIIVPRDEKVISLMKDRIEEAIEIKKSYVEQLKNKKQFAA
jgi:putative phage-type endonuclease